MKTNNMLPDDFLDQFKSGEEFNSFIKDIYKLYSYSSIYQSYY